jgi:ankyrin repeat protein
MPGFPAPFMNRFFISALTAGMLASVAHAQGMSSGDVNEWSAFHARVPEPERLPERTELTFHAIKHEGPFAPSAEVALSADTRQLIGLLQQQHWSEALSHLKATQADLNRRDESGATPLSIAAYAGQLELVREMLRQGALPDQVGAQGLTPLGAAAWQGHELVVQDLLREGARVDMPGTTGQLPLHLACASGRVKVVRMLLQQGADWRAPNRQGRHALEEAAYFGQVPVMQALVDAGANLAEPDRYGLNAVHAAALGAQTDTLAWLHARGMAVPSVLSQVLIDQINSPAPTQP